MDKSTKGTHVPRSSLGCELDLLGSLRDCLPPAKTPCYPNGNDIPRGLVE